MKNKITNRQPEIHFKFKMPSLAIKEYLFKIYFCSVICFFLAGYFESASFAQSPRTLLVKTNFKIDEGNLDGSYMVMENVTTAEKQTLKGISNFNIYIKFNCTYILSFSKPGYITKKIELNTSAPAERIEQGFYPVEFNVYLFKQIEGVNIVVFNQPVGKWNYNKMMDEFHYDTDYTKQIQSAIKDAEDEIKKKNEEAKLRVEQTKKDAEKTKQDSIANAKIFAKEKQDSIAAAKQLAAVKAEEERKAKLKADEETRQQLNAKAEEEAKQKLAAKADEEERRKLKEQQDTEAKEKIIQEKKDAEERRKLQEKEAAEERASAAVKAREDAEAKRKASLIQMQENKPEKNPDFGTGNENRSNLNITETPPDVNVETIEENNRTITKATVIKNGKQKVYSKVVYKWGGIFYFLDNQSISENLFRTETLLK